MFCTLSSHCQCFLCPFFPLCFTAIQQLGILFFFLQDMRSSSPCRGLRDLMQEPSTTFRTFDHLIHALLMPLFHLPFLILLFHFSNQTCHFCVVSPSPGWSHAFSQSAASNSATHHLLSASILSFHLIFFVISFIIFILCCRFISSPSVESSGMLFRRCRLCSLNKAKILAQQSSHHFRILYFMLFRTRLMLSRTSSSIFQASLFQHSSISS